jgi:fatty-acid desaturase
MLTCSASANDIARTAYEEAVALFKRELTQDECKRIWLRDKSNMDDVQQAIRKARDEYERENKKSKVRTWLSRCALRIVHYGNVMDVLVQGWPDYASLVWGGLKFLFLVSRWVLVFNSQCCSDRSI